MSPRKSLCIQTPTKTHTHTDKRGIWATEAKSGCLLYHPLHYLGLEFHRSYNQLAALGSLAFWVLGLVLFGGVELTTGQAGLKPKS